MTQRNRSGSTRPHYRVDIDMEEDSRPVTLDARSLTLPAMTVLAVVISSVTLTYSLSQERTRLDKRIDTVVGSVERLATSISSLADGLKYGTSDRFTKSDQSLWCARAELVNKSFKCPDEFKMQMSSPNTMNLNTTLDSVARESSEVSKKSRSDLNSREDKE